MTSSHTGIGSSDVGHLLRDLAPRVLAVVARRHRDFASAEDAVQEALIAAAEQWPRAGVPANPAGWLHHVAVRRLADQVRSEAARHRREEAVAGEVLAEWAFVPPPDADVAPDGDDSLALLFMCCHPALTPPTAIALTLRALGGLTTAEIARAFLVPEATMAQRISRAKQSIRAAGATFTMPADVERDDRLGSVLHVLYLIFNEGYASSEGPDVHRVDLAREAIRLTRAVHALLPTDGEVSGLLALMLLTDARRAARVGPGGELVPLDAQDRSLWDRTSIAEGTALAERSMRNGAGTYAVQAAIAALHDEAASVEETDWPQILALYDLLDARSNNPMVKLNRAVAVAMVHGPAAGLAELERLDGDQRIAGHYRLEAVRAHLLDLAGDADGAAERYRAAADRTSSIPERDYLLLQAATAGRRATSLPSDPARRATGTPRR
jgi:RNA polymerase sigma factor (sigma-70 family)